MNVFGKSPLPQSTQTVQFFDIGTKEPSSITGIEIQQRKKLVEEIERKAKQSDYITAYKNVIEEVAYTWFNRLIAIRFMEVNDYLPTRIRVLSSESNGKAEPDLVTHALEVNLDYSAYEKDRIIQLKHENKLDELFRMLFIKQCNALNANLPELFEKTSDYTELLLNVSFTDKEGVVYHLVNDIEENNFNVSKEGQVEIIGWLYQYYNEERKNEVININKRSVKKEDIPAATQLFTTDWVVRYMVDNSLGRYWIERNPNSKLFEKLQYLVKPQNGEIQVVNERIKPEELTIFDPCMGSGHILVYAFDVLMEIYRECGFADRDAAQSIINNNIYGLDIDHRAYQLAYFAVIMKARSFDRRLFSRKAEPNIAVIEETNSIKEFNSSGITIDLNQNEIGEYLIKSYKDAKEIGSLLSVNSKDYRQFLQYIYQLNQEGQLSIENSYWFTYVKPLIMKVAKQAMIMSRKYKVVCTNPPYLNKLEGKLKKYIDDEFRAFNGDLFSVFIRRNFDYCSDEGYSAFMSPYVWMFIKTYEQLREYILLNKSIITLIQMEYSAFEEATVPICSFILQNGKISDKGLYFKLSDFKGGMDIQKIKVIEAINNNQSYYYETSKDNFLKIPGCPIAFWASQETIQTFNNPTMEHKVNIGQGLKVGDTKRFVRCWHEVDYTNINRNSESLDDTKTASEKWYLFTNGGEYRKWYGNLYDVVNWQYDGEEVRNFKDDNGKLRSRLQNMRYYFKEGLTWSALTSKALSVRYIPTGIIYGGAGYIINSKSDLFYYLGLLNSKSPQSIISILSETLNYEVGNLKRIPVVFSNVYAGIITKIVSENIEICKDEWDSFEISWDFVKHPLINGTLIKKEFEKWEEESIARFIKLKSNEEELNRIFIEIYGLNEEQNPKIEDNEITIRRADLSTDIRSLISYAIGCIFGRYSLDTESIVYAGGKWNELSYSEYIPDKDNIIPITDEGYFQDDIIDRFVSFIKVVYGHETLESNLDFIAEALGNNGNSSRDVIRNYFIKDFFKEHCQMYQKRPIYWLFDSGKQNGFKALVYMHRYDENTIGNLRIDYLHKIQRIYENEIARMQDTIENSRDAREVTAATKRKEKLIKQLQETKEYDEKIAHLALARTSIDLDDGVKVNYEKIQTDRDGKKLDVLAKI